MTKLNLGSGNSPIEGYVNVDISPNAPKVDVVHDLDRIPWPFGDGSTDQIVMSHCLEHLKDRNAAMREIHRILKVGGHAVISVPHFTSQWAYADPTHKHLFAYPTFSYYAGENGSFDFKFSSCSVRMEFDKGRFFWDCVIEPIANRFPTLYETSPLRLFPATALMATLIK